MDKAIEEVKILVKEVVYWLANSQPIKEEEFKEFDRKRWNLIFKMKQIEKEFESEGKLKEAGICKGVASFVDVLIDLVLGVGGFRETKRKVS
jgi:hypothetical protein